MGIVLDGRAPSHYYLHFCTSKCLFWKVDPRWEKIKKPLGITKCISYLQQAGLPAWTGAPERDSSTQPAVRGPTHSGTAYGATCRAGEAPGGLQRAGTYFVNRARTCQVGNLSSSGSPSLFSELSFCPRISPTWSRGPPTPLICRFEVICLVCTGWHRAKTSGINRYFASWYWGAPGLWKQLGIPNLPVGPQ